MIVEGIVSKGNVIPIIIPIWDSAYSFVNPALTSLSGIKIDINGTIKLPPILTNVIGKLVLIMFEK